MTPFRLQARPRSVRLLAPAVVGLLALGGLACSGDDGGDDDARATTTTEAPTTTGDQSTTTDDDGDEGDDGDDATTTTAAGDDDDTTSTTEGSDRSGGDLTSRLPELAGYERDIDDDGDQDGFTGEHCDGSTRSVDAVEQAAADYDEEGDDDDDDRALELLSIAAMRFASEDDASTAYGEFVDTTTGCTQEGLTVDGGAASDIGDEGTSWGLSFGEGAEGSLYLSRIGDELWFLVLFDDTVAEPVLAAFTSAVEG